MIINDKLLEKSKLCGMFTPYMEKHWRTQTCKILQRRKANVGATSLQRAAEDVTFRIKGEEVKQVRKFKYIGCILNQNDNDRKCILAHFRKTIGMWFGMGKILKREDMKPFQMRRFYVAVL